MKIIFMGTPDFAVPCLEVCGEGHQVPLVITQPDRPKGRGHKLMAPPVKVKALEMGFEVVQPERIKRNPEIVEQIRSLEPDVIVVVAYGQILSKEILDIPRLGCINVHGSLLPKYRGASPIQWSIVQGEKVTGVTTMYMAEGLDTGDMLLKRELAITEDMDAAMLHDALMVLGADVLKETLLALEAGNITAIPQVEEESSYAPLLKKEMAQIDWNKTSFEIIRSINGFNPWPVAYTKCHEDVFKVYKAHVGCVERNQALSPGVIMSTGKKGIEVSTGDGSIFLTEIQVAGSSKMSGASYVLGHDLPNGTVLG